MIPITTMKEEMPSDMTREQWDSFCIMSEKQYEEEKRIKDSYCNWLRQDDR